MADVGVGANVDVASARVCTNCGTALQGKFCSSCGVPATSAQTGEPADEGWGSLTSDFLSSHGRNGIFSVALSFLRHPVDTIIRLTNDPTYRSQWGFLTATVGAQLSLVYVIIPRIFSAIFNVQSVANSSGVLRDEIVQYVGMAILTPIQFYICRALGSQRRTPMAYVKLCVLSVSYGAILSSIVALTVFAAAIVIMKTNPGGETGKIVLNMGNVFGLLATFAILVFVSASHRRFWGMSWPVAIGVTICIAAMSWLVVYPGLTAIIERGGVVGALNGLLGG